jgi:hypothetical protein
MEEHAMAKRGTKKATPKKKVARATAEKPVKPRSQPAATVDSPPAPKDDSDEIVVFAIRLKRSERDLIHQTAGSGKASQFVRGLAIAAANGDLKQVQQIVQATK